MAGRDGAGLMRKADGGVGPRAGGLNRRQGRQRNGERNVAVNQGLHGLLALRGVPARLVKLEAGRFRSDPVPGAALCQGEDVPSARGQAGPDDAGGPGTAAAGSAAAQVSRLEGEGVRAMAEGVCAGSLVF